MLAPQVQQAYSGAPQTPAGEAETLAVRGLGIFFCIILAEGIFLALSVRCRCCAPSILRSLRPMLCRCGRAPLPGSWCALQPSESSGIHTELPLLHLAVLLTYDLFRTVCRSAFFGLLGAPPLRSPHRSPGCPCCMSKECLYIREGFTYETHYSRDGIC